MQIDVKNLWNRLPWNKEKEPDPEKIKNQNESLDEAMQLLGKEDWEPDEDHEIHYDGLEIMDASDRLSKHKVKDAESKREKRIGRQRVKNYVDMGSDIAADNFVVITSKKSVWKTLLKSIGVILSFILVVFGALFAYICMYYRLVPGDLKGADYSLNGFSVVSLDYQSNLDELREGDIIIYTKESRNILPIIINYEPLRYKSRNGAFITCLDKNDHHIKIQSVDIQYVANP